MTPRENPSYHDFALGTMYRIDPERLAQIRRIVSGMTRCPECDALNPAGQRRCEKCGMKLYPEVKDEKEEEPYVPPGKTSVLASNPPPQDEGIEAPDCLDPEPPAASEPAPVVMMKCQVCEELNKSDQRFCGYCGEILHPAENVDSRVSPKKGKRNASAQDDEKPPYY